jgi:glycosyltransferase involved in cell wall biosynthesis
VKLSLIENSCEITALSSAPALRVLFTCGREPTYTRNEVILRALRARYAVMEITDNRPGSLVARSLRVLRRLMLHLRRDDYDLVFVGFYGYFLMPWIRHLTHRPTIFDAFVSNYDTLCFDRGRFRPHSIAGRLAFWLDRVACNAAGKVLLDTASHKAYFAETFGLPAERLRHLYVGCNEDMFFPQPRPSLDDKFRILYYSSYLPLHGVEHIVTAASLLRDRQDLHFRLIGRGMNYPHVRRLAEQLDVSNLEFLPPVPYTQLPGEITAADLCLGGPFGNTSKARRVIPGKTFQFLATARPVVATDTPGNRELLTHRQNAYLVPLADAGALARAIVSLQDDVVLRKALASAGHERYVRRCSEAVIRQRLYCIIEEMIG